MPDILPLLQCLQPYLTATTLGQFERVIVGMLGMTGRVTMLGISRWAGAGGSYRTIQRFFYSSLPWAELFWLFFRQELHREGDRYVLAGDEVVVTKAGRETFGVDRFFSSLYGKPIPGVAFFTLSLVNLQVRHSFPLRMEQVVKPLPTPPTQLVSGPFPKRKPGRPKGSKNKNKGAVPLTPELLHIQAMVQAQCRLMRGIVAPTHLVLDGHFGNNNAVRMTRQCDLHLVSKLRSDSALYFPDDRPHQGMGPHRKYGVRLDVRNIPASYLKETTLEDHIQTQIYQMPMLHKEFSQTLNVVVIVKTNLKTQAHAHVILFSTDLDLPYTLLIDYYALRFQIEFNFRDAKQYWGLEDFMNVTQTAVTNAANLSLFMVNVAYRLLRDLRQGDPALSVLDLKAQARGYQYVTQTIKLLVEKPEPILLHQIFTKIATLGRIHPRQPYFSPS
jgi:putative transposase